MKLNIDSMKFNLNIREKLTLQFLLLVSFLFLFFSVCIYFFSNLYLEKRFFKRLQDRAITTSTLFFDLQTNHNALMKIVDGAEKEYLAGEVVSIYETNRDIFVFSTNLNKEEFHRFFIKKLDPSTPINNLDHLGNKMAAIRIPDKGNTYWVLVSGADKTGEEALQDLKSILMILSLVALLLIAFLGWYFAAEALSPISEIIGQLQDIFPKNLNKRIRLKNFEDEIGQLASTINKLLERVEASIYTQKMFVANISHEIKNPLTKIFTQIELLEMKYRHQPEFHEKIMSLRNDSLQLNQLTSSIMELANIISDYSPLPTERMRIDETLWESVAEIKKWNPTYIIKTEYKQWPESETDYQIEGNAAALKIVFNNLLDNACKFSDDRTALVHIDFEKSRILITVSNQGLLIPEQDIPKLFQPFFRVNATAKGKKGHGVGLAIVHRIIEMHKGKIRAYTTPLHNVFEASFEKF
jgi:signal transduction histidine kinase